MAPFCSKDFKKTMSESGAYLCGGNLMWLEALHSVTPGCSPTRKQIENYTNHYLKKEDMPKHIQHTFVIAVTTCDVNPIENAASLKRCSPEEPHWSILLWVADELQLLRKNRAEAKAVQEQLHTLLLSVKFEFRKVDDPAEMRWISIQGREDIAEDYNVMGRTGYQRVLEVARNFLRDRNAVFPICSFHIIAERV